MDEMTVSCPQCGSPVEVPAAPEGSERTCPNCSTTFVPERVETDGTGPIPTITLAASGDRGRPGSAKTVAELLMQSRGDMGTKYITDDEIARGGMGIVLRVIDADIRREVAKKVMLTDEASDEKLMRFIEEGQVTGQLEHPNIVPVHELGLDDEGRAYFTMKLVKGRSLQEVLDGLREGGRESEESYGLGDLLSIFLKVCDGVGYAHSRGVIHRDLKPANIMIGEFGEVLVMDWGLAKVAGVPDRRSEDLVRSVRTEEGSAATVDGQIQGTLSYMPPEQAAGEVESIGPHSDIYSLGAILYEMLCLEPPVQGQSVFEAVLKITDGEIDPPEERSPQRSIPRELSAIAMKALAKGIEERYDNATSLAKDIRLYLEGRAVSAKEDTLIEALTKLIRRNKQVFGTAVIAAALLLALGVYSFFRIVSARDTAVRAQDEAEESARLAVAARQEAERARREAVEAREQVVRNAMLASERFAKQALRMIDEGRMREARYRADDAVLVCEEAPFGWYARAMAEQAANRHEEAILLFRKALTCDPGHGDSRLAMAKSQLALRQMADREDALTEARLARDELGEDAATKVARGDLPTTWEDADTLIAGLEEEAADVSEAKPSDWRAMLSYAGTALQVGKYEEAEKAYAEALDEMKKRQVQQFRVEECEYLIGVAHARAVCARWYPRRDELTGNAKGEAVVKMLRECHKDDINIAKYRVEGGRVVSMATDPYNGGGGLRYLDPLKDLQLTSLALHKCGRLSDLSPLKGLPLKSLELIECPGIRDMSALKGMPLERLAITAPGQEFLRLSELAPLQGLPLRVLTINGEGISDLSPLRGLPLEELSIRSKSLRDTSPLRELAQLKKLAIHSEATPDLTPLRGLPLESLAVGGTWLTDISALKELPQLKSVGLHSEYLRNLEPLKDMELERLDLDGCTHLSDLSPLRGMPLTFLDLDGCASLRDLSPLRGCPIKELYFDRYWEQVRDPSGLEQVPLLHIRNRVASVYLKFRQYDKAEKVCRSMGEQWPDSKEAFLGLRTLAQINIQQWTPKGLVAVADPELRFRRLKPTPLEGATLEQALSLCEYLIKKWPEAHTRAVSRMLRARVLIETGRLTDAREELTALLKECAEFEAGETPYPESIAAAYMMSEQLSIGGEGVLPGEADLGPAPAPVAAKAAGDAEPPADAESLTFGPTDVLLKIYPSHGLPSPMMFSAASEILPDTPLNAVSFFVACRHLLANEHDAAAARLKECVEVDAQSSYGRQAARMLARMAGK